MPQLCTNRARAREANALALDPGEQYAKPNSTSSKLHGLAWSHATKGVHEAVLSVHAGHEPSGLSEDATLAIADAITLHRLNSSKQKLVANLVDSNERGFNATTSRIQRVVKAAKAALSQVDKLDSDSVTAFLTSPMRADIPTIAQAAKKRTGNINLATADAVALHESGESEGGAITLGERYPKANSIAVTPSLLSGMSQGEVFALGLDSDEQYPKPKSVVSKLQILAWSHATHAVQEAVHSVNAGHELSGKTEDATLAIADAIALRQLGGSTQEYIAKLVDPDERSAKLNSTKARIHRVDKVTNAAVRQGFDKLDSGSVSAFLKSSMRANFPRIAQAPKKDKIVNGSIVRPDRKEQ